MEKRKIVILFIVSLAAAGLFTLGIRLADPLLDRFPHLSDQGPAWYYWKLPQADTIARISAWALYGLHQLLTWLFVRSVMKSRAEKSARPLRLTLIALLGNAVFIVLALLVPLRGLFFGKKIPLPARALDFIRRYHGYYIAWALVYTFWFHPMDGDWQLIFGFLYMFFLFIQVSFAATFIHVSLPWITLLEVFVAAHGSLVAYFSGSAIWPMFLFGFLLVFIVTQLFGLKLPAWLRVVAIAAYAVGVGVAYYFRGYEKLYEITFIPLTLYAGAVALPWLVALGQRVVKVITEAGKEK